MSPRSVYRTLVLARCRFMGIKASEDYVNGMWADASIDTIKLCERLSERQGTEKEYEFLAGCCVLEGGLFWDNVRKNCGNKSPHLFMEELFSRTEADTANLKKLMKDLHRSAKELQRVPTGGKSIARALVESLAISPWCYILHFDVADGISNDEVKTKTLVKELCKCREIS